MMELFFSQPFLLACVSSLGTFVGGVIVLMLVHCTTTSKARNEFLIGTLQAASGGVMLFLTFMDLIPESVEKLGKYVTMVWFFYGVLAFGVIELFVVPDALEPDHDAKDKKEDPEIRETPRRKQAIKSKQRLGMKSDVTDSLLPSSTFTMTKREMKRASFVTFLAMFLHNIPEGLGVYLSALSNMKLGLQLCFAILLHNIPEGMAISIPLWAATGSVTQVLGLTLLNGLAEPLGVVLGGFLLRDYISDLFLSKLLAGVGGMMACISVYELYPSGIAFSGKSAASLSLFVGMFLCFVSLEIVDALM